MSSLRFFEPFDFDVRSVNSILFESFNHEEITPSVLVWTKSTAQLVHLDYLMFHWFYTIHMASYDDFITAVLILQSWCSPGYP